MKTRHRTSLRGWIATVLTALLVASGVSIGTLPAAAIAPTPEVTVTTAPAAGGTITVAGSGFDPIGDGVYVGLAPAGPPGFYQAAAQMVDSVWVAVGNVDGTQPDGKRHAPMNVDGTFSVTFTAPAKTGGSPAYAVYTSKAHGAGVGDPSQDTITAVGYAAAPDPDSTPTGPTLSVSKTTGLDASGETVTVTGAGYDPAIPMYLIVCDDIPVEDVDFNLAGLCRTGAKQITNSPKSPTMVKLQDDGTFTTEFTVERSAAFTNGAAIYTLANHENMNDRTQDVKQPIAFSPLLTVSQASGLNPEGDEITVTGLGYDPAVSMYLILCRDAPLSTVDFAFAGSCTAGSKSITNTPTRPTMVKLEDDGTFTTTFAVKNSASLADGAAIYTVADHRSQENRSQDARRPISFTGPSATSLAVTSSPSSAVEGTSFNVTTVVTPAIAGTVALTIGQTEVASGAVADGKVTLALKTLRAGVNTVKATFTPADPVLHSASEGTVEIVVTPKKVVAGSLTWGVKEAFRSYVVGPIAGGSIVGSGVGVAGSSFVFAQGSGGSYTLERGTGTSNYTGTVRFSGHGGALDLRLSNPVVRIDSASTATLLLSVNGRAAVPFATLALASGTKRIADGAVSYSGVRATLTTQGAAAFANGDSQFYPAGTGLDPVSFTIGAPGKSTGGTRTLGAFAAVASGIPPTPPASTGITLQGSDPDQLGEGDQITISADGFAPNEEGIDVVVYSDPIVLATDVRADAQGVATWTGFLPDGLTGSHTITMQGSVDRGIEITIAERVMVTSAVGCLADAASLTWGFKEAFRSYISGSIANGEWAVADGASYEIPNFGWADGEGSYDAATAEGLIAFAGSVQFTGHSGALDTTIANPQVRFDGEGKATLLLDISGTTRDGETVNTRAVEFATIDLAAVERNGSEGEFGYAGAPAVLTPAGAAAFGTYPAGEALDPITVSFSSECAAAEVAPVADDGVQEEAAAPDLSWLIWAVGVLLLVVAAIVTAVLVARRRAAA